MQVHVAKNISATLWEPTASSAIKSVASPPRHSSLTSRDFKVYLQLQKPPSLGAPIPSVTISLSGSLLDVAALPENPLSRPWKSGLWRCETPIGKFTNTRP